MEKILFLAHTEAEGQLGKHALEALSAAKALAAAISGSELIVGLVGAGAEAAAGGIASCGASRFLAVTGGEFAVPRYGTDAAAAEAVCRKAEAGIVVAPGTSRFMRVLAGVTLRLGGRIDTHVTAISTDGGTPSVSRWYYRQRMEAVLTRSSRPWVIVVDQGNSTAWQGQAGTAKVEQLTPEVAPAALKTSFAGYKQPAADEQTIRPDADLLFVAGAGWTKKQADGQTHTDQATKLILGFLHQTHCSLGSSKSLVDIQGEGQAVLPFLTHLNQIGQTGSTPRHNKGLATCCHGEEPHVVGWRFITERRAVNTNPGCGWAQGKADVLYVADAFEVMAKVNELLSAK